MKKYMRSAYLSALEKFNSGIVYLLPDMLIKVCTLIPLTYIWRVVMAQGVSVGMTLPQMLTHTYTAALLSDLLVVKTAATGWLSGGVLQKLFGRPMSVFGQLTAQTVGSWAPNLCLFTAPMALLAPLFGVKIFPLPVLFLFSLPLCVSLGFAIDFLFACLSIKMRNMEWLINRIRMAIAVLLSGTIIPIRLLPFGLDRVMRYQPFASLGGASLAILIGSADTAETITLQIIWNAILWPLALFALRKSREGIVSYGG
ncbi:MAG: hypothetical protein FWG37_02625 [Clostridia bacterium]|nr:hypothetical protein [Clostridia bacterium]